MNVTVYTTPACPNCKVLKSFLEKLGVEYDEKNMLNLDVQTELIMMDVYALSAPILRVGNRFLTVKELFNNGKLNEPFIFKTLEAERVG